MASFPRAALFFLVLLVAFLCSFAITLDVDERQKEEDALQSVDEDVSEADGVPDPPQNLVVDPQSDTMIMLFWEDPADDTDLDHYFVYVEEEEGMEHTTKDHFCAFDNLEASTEYTFGVMSVSAEGDMSDPVLGKGQTVEEDDGVPDPPQSLIVQPQSPTSILLVWHDPDDTTDLDHYLVYVEGEDMQGTTTLNYYFVENLEACTDYTLGVMSVSVEGNMSDPILAEGQTEVGAPPAPQNLAVDGYTSTTVTLSWDKPDTLCDVEEYRVKWIKDDFNKENKRTNETSFTATGLSINTTYTFTVTGFTEYGEGEEATVHQTTKVFDGGPPENIVAVGISMSKINVSWTPPAYEPPYYVVTAPPCVYLNDAVFGLSYLITGLDPCESCSVFVTSYYNDTFQYTADTVGSSQGGVKELNCEPSGSGQVSLSWSLVDPACPISSYNVTWVYESLWSNDTGKGSQDAGKYETSSIVASLPPYSNVSLQIHVDNSPEYSECITVTSQEKSSPPTTLKQTTNSISSVTITWDLPQNIRGELEEWYLRWTTLDGEPIDEDTVSEVQRRTYTISELFKSRTYVVYVSAVNGAGNGEEGGRNVNTGQVPTENSPNTGLIIGLSAAGGMLLILLLVGSIILCRRRGLLKSPRSAPHMPEVADADNDELYKMQHLSSASQGLHDKHRSADNVTDRELYVSWPSFHIYETINEDGQMPDSPPGRQVSISLPKEEAHSRSSEQVNIKLKIFEEDNNRYSQQDLPGRPSFSGGRNKPSLRESGRRPSQQIDVGRPNL